MIIKTEQDRLEEKIDKMAQDIELEIIRLGGDPLNAKERALLNLGVSQGCTLGLEEGREIALKSFRSLLE